MNTTNPVIETARKWYVRLAFSDQFDKAFEALTEQYPSLLEAKFASYTFGRTAKDGGKNLLMYLYFCEELAGKYVEKDIPEEVLLDTLSDLPLWAQTHFELTGKFGISEIHWLCYHFQFRLFRLGRLQYAVGRSSRDVPRINLKKGDNVLEIHIPRGEPLAEEACDISMERAGLFFAKYFPEIKYRHFTCQSWLLDNTLERFLCEDSNILRFQHRFQVVHKDESIDALRFTISWGLTNDNIATFQPTNGFTRRIVEHVQGGGKLYTAWGYLKPVQNTKAIQGESNVCDI